MNKKKDPSEVRTKHHSFDLNLQEQQLFEAQLQKAGGMKEREFVRIMLTTGKVSAKASLEERKEYSKFLKLFGEFTGNFSRISNYIKYTDPQLVQEIQKAVEKLTKMVEDL